MLDTQPQQKEPLAALVVDDDAGDRALVMRELRRQFDPLAVVEAPTESKFESALRAGDFDAAVVDYKLGWTDGLTVLRRLKAIFPARPVIMFTASGNEEVAVEAMHSGLDDYVLKSPRHHGRLVEAVERALGGARERSRLRSLEDRYRGFFERVPVGAFRISPEGQLIDVNPQIGRLLGVPAAALLGSRLEDYFANPATRRLWRDALRTGRVDRFEAPITTASGLDSWVQIEAVAPGGSDTSDTSGAADTTLFLEGVMVDVTERRWTTATEQLVAEVAERLAASFASHTALAEIARLALPVVGNYCRIDLGAEGGIHRTVAVAYLDDALRVIVEEPEWVTTGHAVLAPPCHEGAPLLVGELLETDLSSATPSAEQRAILQRAGVRSLATVPMIARGRALGTLTIGARRPHGVGPHHVSLARRLASSAAIAIDNEQLYRDAKDAVSSRDTFIAIAAHELKTPLATLYGHVQLLQHANDPEAVERGRTAIERQSQRLLALVERMLEMSRLRAGQFELVLAPCDIGEVVAGIVERSATVAPGRLHLEREPVPLVRADKLRVEEVATNLIDNALRYSPRGSPVDVSVRTEGESAAVAITNRGPGIPDSLRERIFAPFARESSPLRAPGLGLGLWISSEIVHRHGGTIGFRSDGGDTTTFFFSLPGEEPHVAT